MKWISGGTAVQGRRHLKKNVPCQDKYFQLSQTDFVCISLADGAGSYKYSEKGAEITSERICNYLSRHFDFIFKSDLSTAKRSILHSIRTSIGIEAKKRKAILDDFSSTLLFVGIKGSEFICGHLGDGILGISKKNELVVLSPSGGGEFVNETYFVTSEDYQEKFKLFKGKVDEIDAFIIMSDGACNSLLDKKNLTLSPALNDILRWFDQHPIKIVNQALETNFKTIIRQKTMDDCSIVLLKKSFDRTIL